MKPWITLAVAAGVAGVLIPALRASAFRAGWFERSTETRARRSARRPTHGGAAFACALLAAPIAAGVGGAVPRAVLVAVAVGIVTAPVVERRRRTWWIPALQRAAVAAAVPASGLLPHVTGWRAADAVAVAGIVFVVASGLARLEHSDGTAPTVLLAGLGGALAVAPAGGVVAVCCAAAAGAALGVLVHAAPPGAVRFGTTGPAVAGAALTAVVAGAVDAAHETGAARLVAAAMLLVVPALAAVVPGWDLRLQARGRSPVLLIGGAATVAAVAAWATADGRLAPAVAPLAALPAVALVAAGAGGARPGALAPPLPGRRLLVGVGAGLLLAASAGVAYVGLMSRSHLVDGRSAAEAGLRAARQGDVEAARDHFERADRAFARARDLLGTIPARAALAVPGVGPNVEAARTVADAGADLSGLAVTIATRAGGADLEVVDGRFPIDLAAAVAADLTDAVDRLHAVGDELGEPSPWLLPAVADAVEILGADVERTATDLEPVAEAARLAPQLLGADGPRRWFVGILAPSELRGAGGLLGDYVVLEVNGGDVSLAEQGGASDLNQAVDDAALREVLPDTYAATYRTFQPQRFVQNLTATPDVPTIGEAILAANALSGGAPVDGVILLDPAALAGFVELTGRLRVPSWPDPITRRNLEDVLLFEHYNVLQGQARDEFQREVVTAVVDQITTGALGSPSRLAAVLGPAVRDGHLRFFSADVEEAALFARIGADGALPDPARTDVLLVANQNGAEAKIDVFLEREVRYEVTHDVATGATTATATVTLRNEAPAAGLDSYVIGGAQPRLGGPGVNRTFVSVYSALEIVGVRTVDGQDLTFDRGEDNGLAVASHLVQLAPGEERTIVFELRGTLPTGGYSLELLGQPAPSPTVVTVDVDTGDGPMTRLLDAEPVEGRRRLVVTD